MLFTTPNVVLRVNNIICSSNFNGVKVHFTEAEELHSHSFYTLAELWGGWIDRQAYLVINNDCKGLFFLFFILLYPNRFMVNLQPPCILWAESFVLYVH